ncbi:MAG: epoxyqueuosine reductase [Desulfobacteraceae bacterium]|nr:epoxyqueuosine reductase [Desulfobacteraceae bacterium]MBC2751320.1 epoxyqueuosine reductase [Desulfobacteraceae bacterium]
MTINDLSQWLVDYVAAYPEKYNQIAIWREPIMACAPADDRFLRLKEITVPDHALPEDLLPGANTVVVWFIPFKHHLQMDNTGGKRPALSWGRAYLSTNDMINRIGSAVKDVIEKSGGEAALTPATHNFDKKRMVSLWSHKHLGHLIGLGCYGTNCQLITPAGCSGRMGSLVTNLALGEHPLVAADELCLVKAGKKCGKCITSCPVDALSEDGLDRPLCHARLRENFHLLMAPDGLPDTTSVCAKCQVGMPCSATSPLPVN